MEGRTSFVKRGGALHQMRIEKGDVHKGEGEVTCETKGRSRKKSSGDRSLRDGVEV